MHVPRRPRKDPGIFARDDGLLRNPQDLQGKEHRALGAFDSKEF